jgi:hypothetical protein
MPKTKFRKSCPSKRAYASGKKKGRCVPKAHRRAGCYARTRADGIRKLRTFRKRVEAAKRAGKSAQAAVKAADAATYTPSKSWGRENKEPGAFWGLGGRRRKRRR